MESKRKDDKEKNFSGRRRRSVANTLNVDLSSIDPISQEDTIPNTVVNSRLIYFHFKTRTFVFIFYFKSGGYKQ
jgi:hypothetical protein